MFNLKNERKNNSSNIELSKNNFKIITNKKKIFNQNKITSYDLIKYFLSSNKIEYNNQIIFKNAKEKMLENNHIYFMNLKKIFDKYNNIKFLGSGINYLVAKKYAQIFSKKFNRSIAFDVIENHKHIDISSEAMLFVFASNINRKGFQQDVFSEVEKFIAHDNDTIIFTNAETHIFDNLGADNSAIKKIIKLPLVPEIYSLSIFEFYFERFLLNHSY